MIARSSIALLLLLGLTREAQAFDCGKASTAVELAICADPELKAADDALGKAYSSLKPLLAAGEQKMLVRSQRRWIAWREGCGPSENGLDACIREETAKRLRLLTGAPLSGPGTGNRPIPIFVVQDGNAKAYDLDVQLLRFDDPNSPGEKTLNRITREAAGTLKLGSHGEDTSGAIYGISQDMVLAFASPDMMSVRSYYWTFTGGAHGNGGVSNFNIDMASGGMLEIVDFFSEDAAAELAQSCREQLIAEKRRRNGGEPYDPAADDFLKDGIIAEHIATISRWSFAAGKASVSFDPYAIGSYAEGQYDCTYPMDELWNVALDDAPLPQ